MIKFFSTSFLAVISLAATAATFQIDKGHTEVGFKVKHLVLSTVTGRFKDFAGTFAYDGAKQEISNFDITIQAESIDTNQTDRDGHLKADDFFAVAKNPTIKFKAAKAVKLKDGKGKLEGDLTMRGVTKKATFDFTVVGETTAPGGNKVVLVAEASTRINRKDWGVSWNKTLDKGGVAVSEEVDVNVNLEANPK